MALVPQGILRGLSGLPLGALSAASALARDVATSILSFHPSATRKLPSSTMPWGTIRHHTTGQEQAHGHALDKQSLEDIIANAPPKFQGEARKQLKDFAKLPWEVSMTAADAAKTLGSFLGVTALEPASVLDLDLDQVHAILEATTHGGNKQLEKALFSHADAVTTRFFGDEIYYRGIVEFSNVCQNDCGYCGIRKHMAGVKRYTMPIEEVVEVSRWAWENQLGNVMLQSGELRTAQRMEYLEKLVKAVRAETVRMDREKRGPQAEGMSDTELGMAVSLSVGELSKTDYEKLFKAGARRYLLRIETSNPELYAMLHPGDMSWDHRVQCLKDLKEVGFMIGTGVMVGLPGQTIRDLAGDILFFKEIGANMIGMGPYITEEGTPVAEAWQRMFGKVDKQAHMKSMFDLTTRMNALARVTMGNANISATTALQAIDPMGREIALRRGSNVLMPILTPTKYREHYQLYEGKPCITDTAEECRRCLNARITMIGKKVKGSVWGDPPNFLHPIVGLPVPHADALPTTLGQQLRQFHACSPSAVAPARAAAPLAPSTEKGSDVQRINIGVFGVMNAGKSTLINRITRQETSIVDATPGTTADVKVALMELHDVGPAKLFDTAGIDEVGELGQKKRKKTLSTLKECDVALLVLDVPRLLAAAVNGSDPEAGLRQALQWEVQLLAAAEKHQVSPLLLFNMKGNPQGGAVAVQTAVEAIRNILDPRQQLPWLPLDLNQKDGKDVSSEVATFLQEGVKRSRARPPTKSLPAAVLCEDAMVFLNIPMDAETPSMRLLRPQALVQEEAIRHWANTISYRMDLGRARSKNPEEVAAERRRFMAALRPLLQHPGPKLLVTDSQAVDIVHPWTLAQDGSELVPFTTFSVCMIQRQSAGQLSLFAEGLKAFKALKPGDRVLVAEACNHNRITDVCNDIGMVQIPQKIVAACGEGVVLDHAFGREYPDLEDGPLGKYKLAIHCGGCMIDSQKMRARISDMEEAGVPVTNYGLFLSYVHSPAAVRRALAPWGLSADV